MRLDTVSSLRLEQFGFHAAFAASFAILFFATRRVWPTPREGAERWLRKLLVLGFLRNAWLFKRFVGVDLYLYIRIEVLVLLSQGQRRTSLPPR